MARPANPRRALAGLLLLAVALPGSAAEPVAPAMDVPPGLLGVVEDVDSAKGTFRMDGREMALPKGARGVAPGQTVRLLNDTSDGRVLEMAPAGAGDSGSGPR